MKTQHSQSFSDDAAVALDRFVEASQHARDASPKAYCPHDPQAAREFWDAIKGLGYVVGDDIAVPKVRGYDIIGPLARGGMGIVYEAVQHKPRRPVALKVLDRQNCDPYFIRLFEREIQALARLKHPWIASIYEAGQAEDGRPFFTMELVEGCSLSTYVREHALSTNDKIELFKRICEAMHYAHQRGIIHHDLKPSNILIDEDGNPKVLDFGLAQSLEPGGLPRSADERKLQGTLPYMSPERLRGEQDIDVRSDVYALGVMLYEMISGQLPIDVGHTSVVEASQLLSEQVPQSLARVAPQVSADLDAIVQGALAKDLDQRYQSVAALLDDLNHFVKGRAVQAYAGGAIYRCRKFITRHKLSSAVVISVLAAASLLVVVAYQSDQISAQRHQARYELTRARFMESILHAFMVEGAGNRRVNPLYAMNAAKKHVKENTSGAQDLALLNLVVGESYVTMKMHSAAVSVLSSALEYYAQQDGMRLDRSRALIALQKAHSMTKHYNAELSQKYGRMAQAELRAYVGDEIFQQAIRETENRMAPGAEIAHLLRIGTGNEGADEPSELPTSAELDLSEQGHSVQFSEVLLELALSVEHD